MRLYANKITVFIIGISIFLCASAGANKIAASVSAENKTPRPVICELKNPKDRLSYSLLVEVKRPFFAWVTRDMQPARITVKRANSELPSLLPLGRPHNYFYATKKSQQYLFGNNSLPANKISVNHPAEGQGTVDGSLNFASPMSPFFMQVFDLTCSIQ